MIGRVVLLILSIVATTLPCAAAQPALEPVRIGIPGKLADFGPLNRVVKELSAGK